MRGPLLLLPAVAMAAVVLAPTGTPVAHACCVVSPGPTVEERVAEADLIFTGTVTASEYEPPFDPNTPDEFVHIFMVTLKVTEYLKGNGPSFFKYETSWRFWFEPDGTAVGTSNACNPWNQPPAGKAVPGLSRPDRSPGYLDAAPLDEWGQALLAEVVAALEATPTPVSTSVARATAAPTVTPAELPQSGGEHSGDRATRVLVWSAAAVSMAAAMGAVFAWWRTRPS
jgi:hypothetical protein